MNNNNTDITPYLCDHFTTIGFFANSYAATLRLVLDMLATQHPEIYNCGLEGIDPNDDSIEQKALCDFFPPIDLSGTDPTIEAQVRWPTNLEEYFLFDSAKRFGVTELKHSNQAGTDVCEHLRLIGNSIVAGFEMHAKKTAKSIEKTPLMFLLAMGASIQGKPKIAAAINSINVELPNRVLRTKRTFRGTGISENPTTISFRSVDFRNNTQLTKSKNHKKIEATFSKFLAHFESWFASEYKQDEVYHPTLPGLRLYQPKLQRGFIGSLMSSGRVEGHATGLFCLVREARGSVTSHKEDVNLLVRDLLWIRPFPKLFDEGVPIDEYDLRNLPLSDTDGPAIDQHGGRIGFYYSAIDGFIYEVKRIIQRDNILMIDALALRDMDASTNRYKPAKSMCLYLPIMDNSSLNFTMGTLMGGTKENRRTGGWSIVAIRPELDEIEENSLQKKLCIFADSLELMTRERYNKQISILGNFICETGLVGILHSRDLCKNENDEDKGQEAISAMAAFRDLFKIIPAYKKHCDDVLKEIEVQIWNDGEFDTKAFRSALLTLIEQQNSYAIAPVTVLKEKISGYDKTRVSNSVSKLAARWAGLKSYAEYSKLIKRKRPSRKKT